MQEAKALYNRRYGMRTIAIKTIRRALLVLVLTFAAQGAAWAQTSSSPSYSAYEYSFGTGGDNNLSSSNYSARADT